MIVIPALAQRRAGTQGDRIASATAKKPRRQYVGPWVPDKRFALSGMTI